MGMDQDDVVLAPYTTVMKRLLAQTYLSGIFASALTEDMTQEAVDEITTILRREHKLKASDDDDFTIRTQQELSSMLNTTTDLMTTLLACVAGNFTGRRRYRNHEHHVCIRNGTYTRNRSANVSWCTWHRHPVTIPDRGHTDKYYRRTDWSNLRMRSQLCHQNSGTLAGIYTALECIAVIRGMYRYRSLLRMVSCQKSSRP